MVGRKMTARFARAVTWRAGGHYDTEGIFVKYRSLRDSAVFSGFLRMFEIRSRSGPDQDAIRIGSGFDQGSIRVASGIVVSRFVFAPRLLDGKRHRGKNHLTFCTLLVLSFVCYPRVVGDPAAPLAAGGRRGSRRELGSVLAVDNSPLYILFDRCAMRIFKILLSHPMPQAVPGPPQDAANAYPPRVCGDASGSRKNIFPLN